MSSPRTFTPSPWAKLAYVSVVVPGAIQYVALGPALTRPWRSLALALALSTYIGIAVSDRLRERLSTLRLLLLENALGLALPWIGIGHLAVAPLGVVSLNGLLLDGRAPLLLALMHTASVLVACVWMLPGQLAWMLSGTFSVGVVFVLAFTRVVVVEMELRQDLAAATRRLQAHAAQAEALAALAERERIAREVHDSVGHALVAAHVHLRLVERDLMSHPDRAAVALTTARGAIEAGLNDLRTTVRALNTTANDRESLLRCLETLTRGCAELRVTFSHDESLPPLTPGQALAIYRIAQEALSNAVKHAAASRVEVRLTSQPGSVALVVRDDGRGDAGALREGFGLSGIRTRLAGLGGELLVQSGAGLQGRGVSLQATLPIAPVSPADGHGGCVTTA